MVRGSDCMLHYLAILVLIFVVQSSEAHLGSENGIKTDVFLSPKFVLEPGSVSNKYYYNIDFPRGHIAIKNFNAEVIDEKGNPIPLHETYLHHWVVVRYYQRKGVDIMKNRDDLGFLQSDHILVKNSGVCDYGLPQYFGLGPETRRTATNVPDPYGIEVGNPADVPAGYEERWMLNVHAIDTRGAEDKLGCTECRCDLYNVTVDSHGHIEYDVESCPLGEVNDDCTYTKTLTVSLPTGGNVIYGVAHQHAGGIGSTLYGEGGRVICSSNPIYGTGNEPGNEAGYIVGMSTCYPSPGSVKISAGEMLTLVSNYSSTRRHTGVMGLFYLLVSDSSPKANAIAQAPADAHNGTIPSNFWWAIALFGAGVAVVLIFMFHNKNGKGEGYEAIME
ncbi:hypothetical protein CDL12_22731 [Handroanthus impetiginosus]|uniref:Stress up-regulated Nod 19 n=1 Tax=Handroanthus impetiginosus TaxID=429701 RepID=A0A2G9GHG4_9LAMI|nr:hypothetical protein CDL12_22731 [Handroanthus impetiginosus]